MENRLEALIDDYLAHCLSEERRRNTVQNAYGCPLRHVFLPCASCAREGIEQPSQVTRRTMERYHGELFDEWWCPRPALAFDSALLRTGWSTRCSSGRETRSKVSRMKCQMARSDCPNSAGQSRTS